MGSACRRLPALAIATLVAVSPCAEDNIESRFDSRGRDGYDPSVLLIHRWEADERQGLYLYNNASYERAYEVLSEPARRGLKGAQHAMALMHLDGRVVEKNVLVGTALMGLAAESGDRQLERDYAKLLKSVPDKYGALVEAQVVYYIERYGMAAQGIRCARETAPASNIRKLVCWKQAGQYADYPWAP